MKTMINVKNIGGITRHGEFYVYAKINNKSVLIHRFIMDVTERETMVDHRNKKTLDNRKDNLRVCSNKENLCNVDKPINNTSGYKGVYWYPYRNFNKWMVSVKVDYKFINIGYYDKLEDAVKARNDAELKYYGEFARLQEFKG